MALDLKLPQKPGLLIVGTDISVGKSFIAGALIRLLTEQGHTVGPFKPVSTGCKRSWDGPVCEDTEFLADCANTELPISAIGPVAFLSPGVPLVASMNDKKPVDFARIAQAWEKIASQTDIIIAEATHGIRVPLTPEYDMLDIAVEMRLPVLVVAAPEPGVINHLLLTLDCLSSAGLKIAGVIFNGYHVQNQSISADTAPSLIDRLHPGIVLADIPFDETVDRDTRDFGQFAPQALAKCDWPAITGL
mgnify:CR=1 FL=1